MASSRQQTGMRGVYLVAAELAARGYIVSPTSRSASGADLLVTNQSGTRAFSVEVKTNGTARTFWLVSKKARRLASPSLVYVFVNIGRDERVQEYFVVPSKIVTTNVRTYPRKNSTWYAIGSQRVSRYRARWSVFGRAN